MSRTSLGMWTALALLAAIGGFTQQAHAEARNVILMIGDGAGFNEFAAAGYYNGTYGSEIYDAPRGAYNWVKYGCTTYADGGSYDPAKYDPASGTFDANYGTSGSTDSAAAATSLNTGQKTYAGSINYATDHVTALKNFAQYMAEDGRSVGNVSTVQIAHATPAAAWSHNTSRSNGKAIFDEMANSAAGSGLTVVIGAANPWYDNDGALRGTYNTGTYYPTQATYDALKAGGHNNWTFVEDTATIQNIASGAAAAPARLFAIGKVGDTLQQKRSGDTTDDGVFPALTGGLPSLADSSEAALAVLKNNANGFYLQIEGGAVDWAGHANQMERNIQEQRDFLDAVEAVVNWVEANSDWAETLLVITADHETGMLRGADFAADDTDYFVSDGGAGNLPNYSWNSGSHTNDIVPLFAIGHGSGLFAATVDGYDTLRSMSYVDNTDVFDVMMGAAEVPEPATMGLLLLGGLLFTARRRRGR